MTPLKAKVVFLTSILMLLTSIGMCLYAKLSPAYFIAPGLLSGILQYYTNRWQTTPLLTKGYPRPGYTSKELVKNVYLPLRSGLITLCLNMWISTIGMLLKMILANTLPVIIFGSIGAIFSFILITHMILQSAKFHNTAIWIGQHTVSDNERCLIWGIDHTCFVVFENNNKTHMRSTFCDNPQKLRTELVRIEGSYPDYTMHAGSNYWKLT